MSLSHLGNATQRTVGDGTAAVRCLATAESVVVNAAVAALRQVVIVHSRRLVGSGVHSRRLVGSGDGVEQRAVSNGAVVVDCTRAVTC